MLEDAAKVVAKPTPLLGALYVLCITASRQDGDIYVLCEPQVLNGSVMMQMLIVM